MKIVGTAAEIFDKAQRHLQKRPTDSPRDFSTKYDIVSGERNFRASSGESPLCEKPFYPQSWKAPDRPPESCHALSAWQRPPGNESL